jgi:hypothetical protein
MTELDILIHSVARRSFAVGFVLGAIFVGIALGIAMLIGLAF